MTKYLVSARQTGRSVAHLAGQLNWRWLAAALLISVVALRAYWVSGMPFTHDGENHLARFANYKLAIREGQFPPRIAPSLFNRYGYPVFNYNYPLANILSVGPGFARISYQTIFKVQVLMAVSLGVWATGWWVDQLRRDYGPVRPAGWWSTSAAALSLVSSPYLLSLVLFRGNIGEVWGLMLLPVMFGYVHRAGRPLGWLKWLGLVGVMTAWLLAHNITVLLASPLLASYVVTCYRRLSGQDFKRAWLRLVRAGTVAVALSAWFWLPAVFEKGEVVLGNDNLVQNAAYHLPRLQQLISSPVEFGFSYIGSVDSLSFSLGLAQWLVLGLVLVALIRAVRPAKTQPPALSIVGWWAASTTLLLLLAQLPAAGPVWEYLPLIKFTQFPWRLTGLIMITLLPLVGWAAAALSTKLRLALLALLVGQFVLLSGQRPVDYFTKNNQAYEAFAQSTSTNNENLPRTFRYSNIADWQPAPSILEGSANVTVEEWRTHRHRYSLEADGPVVVTEPTMRFLGWHTRVDGQPVEYSDSRQIAGRIAFQLPAGRHTVESRFTQRTPARMLGNGVSGLAVVGVGVVTARRYREGSLSGDC
ncbi:MAG: hypothetical protein COU69_01605 [Candidatus Pacebacteria bacterium CG10_big_fil_rev_8_21_14_0_10_56_10]|nr:MAG: hypothetical protein COU69_01605 [Candidatus Pacebacteria bacterium CG10_big_fil_rev_8_21_14_0_10_56_10]